MATADRISERTTAVNTNATELTFVLAADAAIESLAVPESESMETSSANR